MFRSEMERMPSLLKGPTECHSSDQGYETHIYSDLSPTLSLYLPLPHLSRSPGRVSFLLELKYKSKKCKAFMQISSANRCLETHKLQVFIRYTRTNTNSLWAQKICYLTQLSAGLETGHVNLLAWHLARGGCSRN